MYDEQIELIGGVEIAEDVEKRVKTTGVRGLDTETAKEKGVWQRISLLLCATHTTIMAANLIYGQVNCWVTELMARRNEIAREMNAFEKAYERFINFWTGYYASGDANKEVNEEASTLYHKIMNWAQLPEVWGLGDPQSIEESKELAIKVNRDNNTDLYFRSCRTNVESEMVSETWGVTKYNDVDKTQTVINSDMDKASALMTAKRLSDDDKSCIYTAVIIRDMKETYTDVMPFKAFRGNETVGKIKTILK